MHIEFRKADCRRELRSLIAFDRKTFPPGDVFDAETWKSLTTWWMLLDGVKVGCCAFERHVDFQGDLNLRQSVPRHGSLYISTTGILPGFQGLGLGALLKVWQIAYARKHNFTRIVTNTRKHNQAMIRLNRKFGFKVLRTTPRYYEDPPDAVVVMELKLPAQNI